MAASVPTRLRAVKLEPGRHAGSALPKAPGDTIFAASRTAPASRSRGAQGDSVLADLICVAFDDPTTASRVLAELTSLQKEYLVKLSDACVVVRDAEGQIHLHQSVPLVKLGATSGGATGAL